MKRLATLPLALLMVWLTACTNDLTSPVGPTPEVATSAATVEAFATSSVVTGFLHSCALTSDGTAFCWGDNGYGQLGSERIQCRPVAQPGLFCESTPVPVRGGLTFTSLTAGAYHTCGITPAGELYCWGLNGDSQLGVETFETCISGIHPCSSTPLRVTGGIRSVEGGFTHTCALTTTGQPYCWGGNLFGQLGVNDTQNRSTPTAVQGQHTFASLETGGYHTCGLTANGVAHCWGANDKGQVGAPSSHTCYYVGVPYACQMTPVPVSGGLTFASLKLGHQHTCGIVPSGPSSAPAERQAAAAEPVFRLASLGSTSQPGSVVSPELPAATGSPGPVNRPTGPSSLLANAVSSSQINLQWTDNSNNEDGFEVWRIQGAGYALVARLGPNVTSYSHTGLQPSTSYTYGVVAFNASGFSSPSNLASATTHAPPPPPPPPPAAPSALQANPASASQVNLAWTDNSGNEDGFRIERHAGDGNFTLVATVGPNVTTYGNGSLGEGTTYTYRVQAFNVGGPSPWSNERSATTWLHTPTSLAAQGVSSSQINLSWNDNSQRETGYEIQRRTGGGSFAPIVTVGANVTSYGDTGLQANTTYTYRVRATSPGATSAWSGEASGTTGAQPPPPPPPTPPAAPTGLSATAVSSSQINLQWTDNSNNEDGFEVWRTTGNGNFTVIVRTGPNVTSYSDTGLQPSTTYYYGVAAFNAAGNSPPSNRAFATTPGGPPPPPPPAAPSSLQANGVSPTQIDLQWTDNSGNEDGFRIERHSGDGNFGLIATVGPNATSYSNGSLIEGTSYTYRVQAFNAAGASAWSNPATPPLTPAGVVASAVSPTQIILTWFDVSNNEDGFRIERHAGDGNFTLIATVGPNVTSYTNTSLNEGTAYTYRVRAFNETGASYWSRTASTWTWLNTPTNLAAQATSSSQINLSWNDNSQRETGYEIHRKQINSAFFPIATVGANATSYSDTGLEPNTTYIYRVRAIIVGVGSASAFSNEASATTHPVTPPPVGPAPPTNLEANLVGTNEIQLDWLPSPDADGYRIERHAGDGAFVEIFQLGVHWYRDRNLQLGTTYTYRVRAYTVEGGLSAYSNEASATTPAPPGAGNTYCWGNNVRGQLGVNLIQDIFITPTRVWGDHDFRMITAGREHTCGVAGDGRGYCWGWNEDGQFGNGARGSAQGSRAPVPMGPGLTWQEITGGGQHSCGISTESLTYCWGQNHRGQVGDGTEPSPLNWRLFPTLVVPPSP